MTQAENYVILFDGGNKDQARQLAENMSISKEQDWENESTVFTFEDGSSIYASGPEFRLIKDDSKDTIEAEDYRLAVDGGLDIAFSGEQIAYVVSQCRNREGANFSGSAGRWTELTLYKTVGGKFVCEKVEYTSWQGERNRHSGAVCQSEAEVIAFCGTGWLAKQLYDEAGIDAVLRVD